MDTWSQDPRKFLVMHLKLRGGVQFSNSSGEIETYLPEVLEPTAIEAWQYRLMLELDGEEQFISVVKSVKNKMGNDFEASDVWTFLYWLVDNELLDKISPTEEEEEAAAELISVPDEIVEEKSNAWVKVPLQILIILVVCSIVMYGSYVTTPIVQNYFNSNAPSEPVSNLAETGKAARMPQFAETSEIETAGRTPQLEAVLPSLPADLPTTEAVVVEPNDPNTINIDVINRLVEMRQEMAACQIRRDEYYLLSDENGYMKEVERISELAKEIGQISSGFEPESTPVDEPMINEEQSTEEVVDQPKQTPETDPYPEVTEFE